MYCSKCGAENAPNSKFCQKCGKELEKDYTVNMESDSNSFQYQQKTINQSVERKMNNENININQQQNQNESSYNNEKKPNKLGIFSLICGIISFISSLFFIISIPFGIVGLILGLKSKGNDGVSKSAIVLNIVGLTISIIVCILIAIAVTSIFLSVDDEYFGDGYLLKYDSHWSITTLSDGQEALQYQEENSYLAPIGRSTLSDLTYDFSTSSGKEELYQTFYDYWNNDSSSSEIIRIYSGSNGFDELIDNIYYATYSYGVSATQIKGEYILLVSPENDAVISFMTNASENVDDNNRRAIELLKSIEIYENISAEDDYEVSDSDNEVIYDDVLSDSLTSLSNWNRYSDLREGILGEIRTIDGGWRILSDSETYWVFDDGEFWWYKSVNDLNDNYWYGTTQILTGKEGLSQAGIDEDKLDTVLENNPEIMEDDIYTIVCTPTKIISGGIDKSDTNIPEGGKWTYIWILVDHGTEGIEAQVFNTSSYNTGYYVKIID